MSFSPNHRQHTKSKTGRAFGHPLINRPSFIRWLLRAFIIIIFVVSGTGMTYAQQAVDTTPVQSTELRVTSIEQRYDREVIQILSNYFDRKKFYVDVNINAEIAEETYSTQQNKIRKEGARNVLMPGLPYLPAENMQDNGPNQTSETIFNKNKVKILRVVNLTVNIYADASLNDTEIDFMRVVAAVAAKTRTARGDVINISRVSIPDLSSQAPTVAVRPENDSTDLSSLFNRFNPYMIGLILLLIIGIITVVSRFNKKPQEQINRLRKRDRFKNDQIADDDAAALLTHQNNHNEAGPNYTTAELDKLIENFFTKPKETALLFESWAVENKEEGVIKAAKVVKTVDKHIIKLIKSELEPKYYSAILKTIEKLPELSIEQKQQIAKEFNALLEVGYSQSKSVKKHGPLPLFQFLEHTSDDDVYRLINKVNHKSAALILDHLSEKRAAGLLDKLDMNLATDIMLDMTLLQDLSYKQRKEISENIFDETMNLRDTEKAKNHTFENILLLLAELPLKEQKQYIEKLKSSEASIGEFIQTNFITIDQIPELDDEIVKAAVSSIPTETLLDAVAGLDETSRQKILSARPQREQRLIEMELQQMENEDEPNTAYAKSILINAIRKTVRQFNKNQLT